jgi:DNA (cytosine-5)-methyltransferase 1
MVAASLVTLRKGSIGAAANSPLSIITAGSDHHALSAVFFEQANGGFYTGDGRPVDAPISTICSSGTNQRLVSAYFVKYYGSEKNGIPLTEPMHTLPTKDRIALIKIVQVPDTLTPEQLEGARRSAAFMREYLPEHFSDMQT